MFLSLRLRFNKLIIFLEKIGCSIDSSTVSFRVQNEVLTIQFKIAKLHWKREGYIDLLCFQTTFLTDSIYTEHGNRRDLERKGLINC